MLARPRDGSPVGFDMCRAKTDALEGSVDGLGVNPTVDRLGISLTRELPDAPAIFRACSLHHRG